MDAMEKIFVGNEPVGDVGAVPVTAALTVSGRDKRYDGVSTIHSAVVATPALKFNGPVGERFRLAHLDLTRYQQNPVVLFEHGEDARIGQRPVGETVSLRYDSEGRLIADFVLHQGDPEIENVVRMWEAGQVRGASVGVRLNENNEFELYEWSIVAVPKDGAALRRHSLPQGVDNMTEEQTIAVEEVAPLTGGMSVHEISEAIKAAIAEALAAGKSAITAPPPEPPPTLPHPTPSPSGLPLTASTEFRDAIILKASAMLPGDYDASGKSDHEILVASVGNEVPNAEERSVEYLFGALDQIASRRQLAADMLGGRPVGNPPDTSQYVKIETILSARGM